MPFSTLVHVHDADRNRSAKVPSAALPGRCELANAGGKVGLFPAATAHSYCAVSSPHFMSAVDIISTVSGNHDAVCCLYCSIY